MKKLWKIFMEMNIIKLYLLTLICHFVWSMFVGFVLYASGIKFSQHVAGASEFTNTLFLIPMCAFFEEVLFRWMPMLLLFSAMGFLFRYFTISSKIKLNVEKYGVLVVVLMTSVIFGYVHGNIFNVFLQGVSGIIFCMFYLRTLYKERLNGKKDKYQIRPLISSSTYHTICNSVLIFL